MGSVAEDSGVTTSDTGDTWDWSLGHTQHGGFGNTGTGWCSV